MIPRLHQQALKILELSGNGFSDRTLQFAPWRSRAAPDVGADSSSTTRPGPYEKPASAEDAFSVYETAFEVEDMDSENLPPGWKIENGYIQLESKVSNYWEVKAGC